MKPSRRLQRWTAKGDLSARRDAIMRGLNAVLREGRRTQSLRMQDVADWLGLVKGNLYYYFKSKQDLLYHCRAKCMQLSMAALDRARGGSGPPSVRLRALIIEHILAMTNGDYSAVLLYDMDNISPARRKTYVKLRDEFERGVRDLISDGIEKGEFAKQDVRMAGFAILGAINWIPKWYRPEGDSSARAIAEHFAEFFIRALQER